MRLLTLPGLIDPHVHLRDMGEEEKEDFYTGTAAALAGGYTTVLDMPNNKEPITTLNRLEKKIETAKTKIVSNIGFYFGSLGDNLDEFEKVKHLVFGLKVYLGHTTGNYLIETNALNNIYTQWDATVGPILVHAFDSFLAAVIDCVKATGKPTHICHVTAADLPQVMKAKQDGLPITCGVTPHHLFLTAHDEKRLGNYGLMKPELETQEGQDFLWKNLPFIDVIESDHAPHTKAEKEGETPAYGVTGLETTLPLLLTAVDEDRITINEIQRLCHDGPKKIFLDKNYSEDEISIDMDEKYTIENMSLNTKCLWSPFDGMKVKGKVIKVVIKGKTVFENSKVIAMPGSGEILTK